MQKVDSERLKKSDEFYASFRSLLKHIGMYPTTQFTHEGICLLEQVAVISASFLLPIVCPHFAPQYCSSQSALRISVHSVYIRREEEGKQLSRIHGLLHPFRQQFFHLSIPLGMHLSLSMWKEFLSLDMFVQ